MPLYHYKCEECRYNNKVFHETSIKFEECPQCGSKNFGKVIPSFSIGKDDERSELKKRVQKGVDEAKEELRRDIIQRKADRK